LVQKALQGWGFSSVVGRLPSRHKALGSVPSSEKKKKEKKKKALHLNAFEEPEEADWEVGKLWVVDCLQVACLQVDCLQGHPSARKLVTFRRIGEYVPQDFFFFFFCQNRCFASVNNFSKIILKEIHIACVLL